jgi:hypothetical protein
MSTQLTGHDRRECQIPRKQVIAQKLADKIADFFKDQKN